MLRNAQEGEHLALKVGELGREDLYRASVLDQLVSFGEGEQPQDLFGGRPCALALLRVEGKFLDVLPVHGQTQLAFDERLDQEGEEI